MWRAGWQSDSVSLFHFRITAESSKYGPESDVVLVHHIATKISSRRISLPWVTDSDSYRQDIIIRRNKKWNYPTLKRGVFVE